MAMARRTLSIVLLFMASFLAMQVIADDSEQASEEAAASASAKAPDAKTSDKEQEATPSEKEPSAKTEAETAKSEAETSDKEPSAKTSGKDDESDSPSQDKDTEGSKVASETAVSEPSAPERAHVPETDRLLLNPQRLNLRQETDSKTAPEQAAAVEKVGSDVKSEELPAPQRAHTPETERQTSETKSAASDSKDTIDSNGMTPEQLEMANQEMKSLLATSSASAAEKEQKNKRLSDLVEAHKRTIADLQAQLDAKTRENTASASAQANMLADLQKQLQDHTAKSEQHSAEALRLKGDLTACRGEVAASQKEVETHREEVLRSKEEEEKQRGEIHKLSDEKKVLSETILKHLEEIAGLRTTVSERDTEINSLKADAAEKTKELNKLKKERQDLRKKHLHLHDQHRKLEAMYADPSVQHFLTAKAVKVYNDPGIEGAANKTFIYVVPTLKERYEAGKTLLNETEAAVYTKLNAYVGTEQVEPWLPAISGSLVYGGVILPFLCTVCCLTRIVCKLRPLLLFCHLDFLLTSLCAGVFAAYSGKEPLAAFAHHDPAVYLFTQAVFAFVYCLYAVLLMIAFCRSKSGSGEDCYRLIQIFGAVPVACIYYVNVWTPAMMDEMPRMDRLVAMMLGEGTAVSNYSWVPYVPVAVNFLVLLELERMCWNTGRTAKEKEADKMSIVMRDDVELASIIPNVGEDSFVADSKGD